MGGSAAGPKTGERGLVSDMAKKFFGEMDVENILAG